MAGRYKVFKRDGKLWRRGLDDDSLVQIRSGVRQAPESGSSSGQSKVIMSDRFRRENPGGMGQRRSKVIMAEGLKDDEKMKKKKFQMTMVDGRRVFTR